MSNQTPNGQNAVVASQVGGALQAKPMTAKTLFALPAVTGKFREILGKKSDGFVASVLSIVNSSALLTKAEPKTILNSALLAASLDLPINGNLGFAAIVPYFNGRERRHEAQFQMMTRGYVQLAIRSGQYKAIEVNEVRRGEIKSRNKFTGEYEFGEPESEEIVGYIAYFKLVNGFEKYLYMTVAELREHSQKYSQTAQKGFGLWVDNFDAMAKKTVLKLLLSKFGVLSVQMQQAVTADGGVVRSENMDVLNVEYVDNEPAVETEAVEEVQTEQANGKAIVAKAMAQSVKSAN